MVMEVQTPLQDMQNYCQKRLNPDDPNIEYMKINECPDVLYEFTFAISQWRPDFFDINDPVIHEMAEIAACSLLPIFRKKGVYKFTQPVFYINGTTHTFGVKIGVKKPAQSDRPLLYKHRPWDDSLETSVRLKNSLNHYEYSSLWQLYLEGKESVSKKRAFGKRTTDELEKIFNDLGIKW